MPRALSGVGSLERPGGLVVGLDVGEHLLREVGLAGEDPVLEQAAHEDREEDLDLVEPRSARSTGGERGSRASRPPLREIRKTRMALLVAEVLDVAGERFVDAQAVVGQQRDQRRGPPAVGVSGVKQALELVAGEGNGRSSLATRGRLTLATGFSSSTATSTL
jgi:hypothetical protein